MARERSPYAVAIVIVGVAHLLFISALPLHWDRWGVPFFYCYASVAAVGVGLAVQSARARGVAARGAVVALATAMCASALVSGLCTTRCSAFPTIFDIGAEQLAARGVSRGNALSESYSPLYPLNNGRSVADYFAYTPDGTPTLKEEFLHARYLVIGTSHLDRMRCEPHRYREQLRLYDAIDDSYSMVLRMEGKDDWMPGALEALNLVKGVAYLANASGPTGYVCSTSHIGSPIHSSAVFVYQLR